ncbi:3'-5' exonuclease [Herbaspirillum lusitanum]|uniref:3'-5' exonuclease n=1 Tax=Herbaspirillum lusitanum TaxID=213312 RepID=UPI0022390766|nr:3'-5' exonuclease [Herbaspirillum lusitanum]
MTKSFNGDLRKIQNQGHKKIVQAVRASMTEAGLSGEIVSLPRTKHGESRIPNVEKYDLPEAYRLVVQLVDGVEKSRAFLFVGNHDDAEHWLDTHRNYRWTKSDSDGTLNFVLVTTEAPQRHVPADRMDLESPEELLALPVLRTLSDGDWKIVSIDAKTRSFVDSITGEKFEQDAESMIEALDRDVGYEKASLIYDLMWHAHAREWTELTRRLELENGKSAVVPPEVAALAMSSADNSESFFTFDDKDLLSEFMKKNTLADWMLFLHPEQKRIVERDLRGAARLRGVSGSGKTCILVHRARNLAKKYQAPVVLVTLTESMRRLLDRLADDLCGVERSLIETKTMSMLVKDTLNDIGGRAAFPQQIPADRHDEFVHSIASTLRESGTLDGTSLASMSDLVGFLNDEISYVRGRLKEADLEQYLDAQRFQRTGRGIPLSQPERRIVLGAIGSYLDRLKAGNLQDHEGFVSLAVTRLNEAAVTKHHYRCVLCDEVQDLSELDVTFIGKLVTSTGEPISSIENGLFLAGDGTQSIYKRGFALRRVGIDILGRSFSLKKNYRNTHEILKAAFGLVSEYEFADVDEENISRPSTPDFAKRHGARPLLLRCATLQEEASAVARSIHSLLVMGQTPGQICVIGPNVRSRDEIKKMLDAMGVPSIELRQDVDYESDRVKISTIESAKGHEFSAVFIMGLVEGVLPFAGIAPDGLPREAARLYVAMTRARDTLTITYSPRAGQGASRFLAAIQADCDEGHLRNGEMRRVS